MAEHKHIWENTAAEADVSYLKEMVTHQASVGTTLGALALGAVLSIPLGLGVGVIPIMMAVAGQSIAALFVPSSPVFRKMVNQRKRRERREAARDHMAEQLQERVGESHSNWNTYERMRARVESLRQVAKSRDTALGQSDLEQLEDATVDYLGLWLAWLVMRERWNSHSEEELRKRLGEIDERLEQGSSGVDKHHLVKARKDLEGILGRRESLWGRAAAVEAAMLAMADTFEEVYQRVVANPGSSEVARELQAAVGRMRVEEQLDLAVDSELEDLMSGARKKKRARARQAAGG